MEPEKPALSRKSGSEKKSGPWRPTKRQVLWIIGMVVALLTTALLIVNLYPEIWKGLLEERNLTLIALGVSVTAIIVLLAIGGATSSWTGFRGKTLWDLLQLLIVPLALAAIGFWFTMQQDARQQDIENQRAQQAQKIEDQRAKAERDLAVQRAQDEALQAYLDQMSGLLLERDLRASEEDSEVRTLARARTLTVLGRVDPSRKTALMQFLVEADLVQRVDGRDPIISLSGADLSDANLPYTDLSGTNLQDAYLKNADLFGANLSGADLYLADLSGANLAGADLKNADLSTANLSGANLRGAGLIDALNLSGANMSDAYLPHADLQDADLKYVDLSGANLRYAHLQSANLSGANLQDADLSRAYLQYANLQDAHLQSAHLQNAYLKGADLSRAILIGADLSNAEMPGTDLNAAFLGDANLSGAKVTNKQLGQATLIRATMPNGQKYEYWLKDREKRQQDE